MEEVYPFLLALGVIEEYRRGAVAWVRSLATDLDPIEVLRLDAQEAGEERACRGEMRFMPVAHMLAQLFRAAGGAMRGSSPACYAWPAAREFPLNSCGRV